jgi:SDR family mycofactocin-dependent oxidoreductase
MGKLDGKVAFITGAARGQGRSHAIRLAEEGADIIAIDICAQIETVAYPMSTPEDLERTVKEVEAVGRRIVARQADVRDLAALTAAVEAGVDELGPVSIILANAGIAPMGAPNPDHEQTFRDTIDVNLGGVRNAVHAAVPHMIAAGRGGAIVLTSSTQGLSGRGGDGQGATDGYAASKHGVVGLMRTYAHWLAPHRIRVNSIHPTGVRTPMVVNQIAEDYFAARPEAASMVTNLIDVDMIEPIDVSNAIAWLVSDEARYVTGVTLPVDAGFVVK